MGEWLALDPEEVINLVLNPSGETTGNFAQRSGTTVTRVTTYAKYGRYSYRIETSADEEGIDLTVVAPGAAGTYLTVCARGTIPTLQATLNGGTNWYALTKLLDLDANWAIYGGAITLGTATTLSITQDGAGTGDFFADGIMLAELDHWASYVDGDQLDCEWRGTPHAASSIRSHLTRAGGKVVDLKDDLGFGVAQVAGVLAAPLSVSSLEFGQLAGGVIDNVLPTTRPFTLTGVVQSSASDDLFARLDDLLRLIRHDRVPLRDDLPQPIRFWFTGAATVKEIAATYVAGLEGLLDEASLNNKTTTRAALQFKAGDPDWYALGTPTTALDTVDSASRRGIAARDPATGQWSTLGLTAGGAVQCVFHASNGKVYVGGTFTDWEGNTGWNNIVAYDPITETWERVGPASSLNSTVRVIIEAPDGTLVMGGAFTDAGGDKDYIVSYDPSTDTFSAIGQPTGGGGSPVISAVYDLAYNSEGILFIVGDFDDWYSIAAADGIVKWNGTAYSAVGDPATGATITNIQAIAIAPNDDPYVAGYFLNLGNDSNADHWAYYDYNGSGGWASPGGFGLSDEAMAVAISDTGIVYYGGQFENVNGDTAIDYLFGWDGLSVIPLGTAPDAEVWTLRFAPDGYLYCAGLFVDIGDLIDLEVRAAKWDGSIWSYLDIEVGGVASEVSFGPASVVNPTNYPIYLATSSTTGTAYWAGATTVNNAGNVTQYPIIKLEAAGATAGDRRVLSIRNETIGVEILLGYTLLDGEELTIDCRPATQGIESSFFGNRPNAARTNAALGQFVLIPGDNIITAYARQITDTVTGTICWQEGYDGIAG